MQTNFNHPIIPNDSNLESKKETRLPSSQESQVSSISKQALKPEEEEEWDINLPNLREKLAEICPAHLQPDENHPFFGSDLVVFIDSYKGLLPLNGIRKSEFNEITKIYQDILGNKSCFAFEMDDLDKDLFAENLQMLLTRPKGRELISTFINNSYNVFIVSSSDGGDSCVIPGDIPKFIFDLQARAIVYTLDPVTGLKKEMDCPNFITLGHELTHILRQIGGDLRPLELPPTIDMTSESGVNAKFDNLEEQAAITGYTARPQIKESDDWLEEYTILNYQPLNENALRAQFRLRPRIDHTGEYLEKAPKKNTLAYLESFPFFKTFNPKDLHFKDAQGNTALHLAIMLKEISKINILLTAGASLEIPNKKQLTPRNLIFDLISSNQFTNVKFDQLQSMIDKIDLNSEEALNLMAEALCRSDHDFKLMQYLLGKIEDINLLDTDGWSLLYYAIDADDRETIKLLLDKGAKNVTHSDQLTVFEQAVEDTRTRRKKDKRMSVIKAMLESSMEIKEEVFFKSLLTAINLKNKELADLLINRVNLNNPLHDSQELEKIKDFLQKQ